MAEKWGEWFGSKESVSVAELTDKLIKVSKKESFQKDVITMLVEIAITTPGAGKVDVNQFKAFIGRFGPFEICIEKAIYSLFAILTPHPIPHRWFHGNQDRKAAAKIMTQDEASMGQLRQSGHFLVRFSDKYPTDFVLSYSKFKEGKLCYKSVVIKNSPTGYYMHAEKTPKEYFATVHALIESEKEKKRLNHSIVSKIYRSVVVHLQKRDSLSGPEAPKPPSGPPTGSTTTYTTWNPTAERPEEPVKPSTGDTHTHAYSIWNAKALPVNGSSSSSSSSSTQGEAYRTMTPLESESSGSVYSSFTADSSSGSSAYATWQDGDKSKSKK